MEGKVMYSVSDNPEFAAAQAHGRRGGMASSERLEALGRSTGVQAFAASVWGAQAPQTAEDCQRRCQQDWVEEMNRLAAQVGGAAGALLGWMTGWYQIQNLKVWLRARDSAVPQADVEARLIRWRGHATAMPLSARDGDSALELVRWACSEPVRTAVARALRARAEPARGFVAESMLDHIYCAGLAEQALRLTSEDRGCLYPLVAQEVDTFHVMLVARGRFLHGLPPLALLPLHVAGTRIPRARFRAMLEAPDLESAMAPVLELVTGARPAPVPVDAAIVERQAAARFERLARRAFRRSHMGSAAVVAYAALRRVEVRNLSTVSEAVRLGVATEELRQHLVCPGTEEVAHG